MHNIFYYIRKASWWLIIILVLFNNLWSFEPVDLKIYQWFHILFLIWFGVVIINHKNGVSIPSNSSRLWILLLMLIPLVSIVSGNVLLGRKYIDGFVAYRMNFGFMLYFVLWYKRVNIDQIIGAIVVLGFGYVVLTLIQQVTYPMAPFGMRTVLSSYVESHSGSVERRLGFYRFEIYGIYYAIIAGALWMAGKINFKAITILMLFIAILASGNRRAMVIFVIAMALIWIFKRHRRNKYIYILILSIISFIVYTNKSVILGDLSNVGSDLEEGRMHSYIYYFSQSVKSLLSVTCGYGVGRPGDGTEDYVLFWEDGKPCVLADIGLVACLYYWGIFYVITLLALFIKLLCNKKLDMEYKCLLLGFLSVLWVCFLSWEIQGTSFVAVLAYLCDLNINNKNNSASISCITNDAYKYERFV